MKKVLVVIDMQNDFIDGALGSSDCLLTVEPVIREIMNEEYDFIALTRDHHQENYLDTLEGKNLPVRHCIDKTYGYNIRQDIMDAVIASKKEYKIFDKKSFGSFLRALKLPRSAVFHILMKCFQNSVLRECSFLH